MPTRIIAFKVDTRPDALVISDSTGFSGICHNVGRAFDVLLEQFEDDPEDWQAIRVTWDLDETFAPILAWLGREVCEQLAVNRKSEFVLSNGRVRLFYVPGKVLWMGRGRESASFYGISQFFPDDGVRPKDVDEIQTYGAMVLDAYHQLDIYPTKLPSVVGSFDQYLAHWNTPNYESIPQEIALLAYKAAAKQWVEARQLGFWEEAIDLDLSSAYPRIMMKLADTRRGKWYRTEKEPPDKAYYGFFDCEARIKSAVTPILFRFEHENIEGETLYAPVGRFPETLSLHEIRYIRERNLGDVSINRGVYWVPDGPLVYPLDKVLGRMISRRDEMKTSKIPNVGLTEYILKLICAGVYGKLGAILDEEKLGPKHNTVWFAMTSILARLKVCDLILDHGLDPIHIATDGVMVDTPVTLTNEDKARGWKESGRGPSLVVSSGNWFFGKTKPQGIDLNTALEMIKGDILGCYWQKVIRRRVTLKEALDRDLDMLGKEHDTRTGITLFTEQKRDFPRRPYRGKELLTKKYRSKPFRFDIGL